MDMEIVVMMMTQKSTKNTLQEAQNFFRPSAITNFSMKVENRKSSRYRCSEETTIFYVRFNFVLTPLTPLESTNNDFHIKRNQAISQYYPEFNSKKCSLMNKITEKRTKIAIKKKAEISDLRKQKILEVADLRRKKRADEAQLISDIVNYGLNHTIQKVWVTLIFKLKIFEITQKKFEILEKEKREKERKMNTKTNMSLLFMKLLKSQPWDMKYTDKDSNRIAAARK